MKWVLLILSVLGEPKADGVYNDHTECDRVVRRINSQSPPGGVWAHCLPLPSEEEKR